MARYKKNKYISRLQRAREINIRQQRLALLFHGHPVNHADLTHIAHEGAQRESRLGPKASARARAARSAVEMSVRDALLRRARRM